MVGLGYLKASTLNIIQVYKLHRLRIPFNSAKRVISSCLILAIHTQAQIYEKNANQMQLDKDSKKLNILLFSTFL